MGGRSSIAGGADGGIAEMYIIIAMLLFYFRRRHTPAPFAPCANNGPQPDGFNLVVDQVLWPMSGEGAIASIA